MQLATKYLDENESRLLNLAQQDPHDALVLSEKEEQILQLHDELKELELERAILAAHATRKVPFSCTGSHAHQLQMVLAIVPNQVSRNRSVRRSESF